MNDAAATGIDAVARRGAGGRGGEVREEGEARYGRRGRRGEGGGGGERRVEGAVKRGRRGRGCEGVGLGERTEKRKS